MSECIRCGSKDRLVAVGFKVDGETSAWEDSYSYCEGCIKELGWWG